MISPSTTPSTTRSTPSGVTTAKAQTNWAPRLVSGTSVVWSRTSCKFFLSSPWFPAHRAEKIPGIPFNASTQMPESSAITVWPVCAASVRAFKSAFAAKVVPSSTTSGASFQLLKSIIVMSLQVASKIR